MIFEKSLIVTLPQRGRQPLRGFLVGTLIGYTFLIAALLIGSILLTQPQLNETLMGSVLISPPPLPPPPPAGSAPRAISQSAGAPMITTAFVPPTLTPRQLPTTSNLPGDDPPSTVGLSGGIEGGVMGGVAGGVIGGVVGGVLGSTPAAPAAAPLSIVQTPEARPTLQATSAKPQRVSTGILLGNTIRQVPAAYPAIARSTHVEGVVEVQIVVDEQGNVIATEVLNGHPLLRQAALEAARQWKFRPTMLNGQPIKVSGVLKFTFKLT